MHYTIPQLQAIDREFPTSRKLLLVPSVNFGRELLASLAMRQGSWIGWEVATLATMADSLGKVELRKQGRRRGSDVAIHEAVNAAFERAVEARSVSQSLASLAWTSGTRRAIADAILELRMSGVSHAAVESVGDDRVVQSLAAVLRHYEAVMDARGLADAAQLFSAAIADFDSQAPFVLDHAVKVATPGWTVRGVPRALFEQLVTAGLTVLRGPVEESHEGPAGLVDSIAPRWNDGGHVLPEVDAITVTHEMFCAGNTADELRAVLRQAVAAGHRLDDIEIACTDRDTYGVTLDALCEQTSISCTMLDGLPIAATRTGRALERWLLWLESGLQSTVLREALESGDFAGNSEMAPTQLAAELRAIRIGWGFEPTSRAAQRLRTAAWRDRPKIREGETEPAFADRRARREVVLDELANLLDMLLAQAPASDDAITTANLATRTIAVLQLMVARGAAERSTKQRVLERLQEIASVDGTPMALSHAIASLRQELADLRAWTDSSKTSKPRRATGGHVHLTNIESAGATGRPLLFIVGLDADRSAGPVLQSPLVPDSLRVRLNDRGADLPTTDQRRRERDWQLKVAMAGSPQVLTLSYAIRGGADGREAGPAPALLEALRGWEDNADISYVQLHARQGAPRSPVPEENEVAIDARDAWFGAMRDGPLLLDATRALRSAFDGLDRGLAAAEARLNVEAGAFHGLVPQAGVLDPRVTGAPISPSSLERIAHCGLRWFYTVALDARVPNEPVFDALVWLNALDRGSALHRIYELVIRQRVHEQTASASRDKTVHTIVETVALEMEVVVPAPSESVRARELAALLDNATLFVTTEHAAFQKEPWETVALESQFGDDTPALFPLPDGQSLRMHGRVDRVDRLPDGTLRLVDYKTGRAFELDNRNGAFDGGRKLQLALYSPAISAQLNAVVSRAEYRFTTAKGDGAVARANEALLRTAPALVQSLLDDVQHGRFLPTIDAADCRYCDYASVCRVVTGRFDSHSPRAEWAKAQFNASMHFDGVRTRRTPTGDE